MSEDLKNNVAKPCNEYTRMSQHWPLIDDLLGGTLAMRAAGETWLPKEPAEEKLAYEVRLNRSVLFEAYKNTVDDLVGRPFSKAVSIQGKLPERLQAIEDDCDGQGSNLTAFGKELFTACLHRGLTHVLVDYPKTDREDGKKQTLADERKSGIRPIFVHIRPDQLIGWNWGADQDGKPQLKQIRWKETITEPDGEYGSKDNSQIRVYNTDSWEIHTKSDGDNYEKTEEGTHTYSGGIPFVTCYVNKDGLLTATPPLEALAWENLSHWQSASDQKNLLRFARFPLLFVKGISETEKDDGVVIGPARIVKTTNHEADMKFVEHTGKAIDSGRQDVKDIEERMEVLGLEPLLSRPGNQTATGQSIDEAKSQSTIQAWIRSLENAFEQMYEAAALWVGESLPQDFKADIYNDFGVSVRATKDIEALIKMRQSGELDRKTFLREVKRRKLLSENVDIEQLVTVIEEEGPSLGTVGNKGGE